MIAAVDLIAGYEGRPVLHGLNLHAERGESVAILGANGAGKSTLFKVLAGVLAPSQGRILLNGDEVTTLDPWVRVSRGLALVPEGRRIFGGLSIRENLLMGSYRLRDRAETERRIEGVLELFPILDSKLSHRGDSLSGGQQQMLAIGRALMSRPQVLLLDEPSLGLAPIARKELSAALKRLQATERLTMLLVEQDVAMAQRITDRYYAIKSGRVVLEGESQSADLTDLRGAYLL